MDLNCDLKNVVNTIKQLSFKRRFKHLIEYLKGSTDLLLRNHEHFEDVLRQLEVDNHTLGYLFVLVAVFKARVNIYTDMTYDNRYKITHKFLVYCDVRQISYTPHIFTELCHAFTDYLIKIQLPKIGLAAMKVAIAKLTPDPTELTSIHADLCQLSLMAKDYRHCLPILNIDITHVSYDMGHNPNKIFFNLEKFFYYFYCGGLIYLCDKQLNRASMFFKVVLTMSASSLRKIMLDSYKKYVLLTLILYGNIDEEVQYSLQLDTEFTRSLQPYIELSNAFMNGQKEKINDTFEKHLITFTNEYNLSLAKQVLSAFDKKQD